MMILATDFHIALRQDLLATVPVPKTFKLFGNDVPTKNDLLLLSTISSGQSKGDSIPIQGLAVGGHGDAP